MTWPTRFQSTPRVDWFRVLMDLKRAGLSLGCTADFVETSKSAVIGWKNDDVEPGHQTGERLIVLWERATGLTRLDLPRVEDLTKVKPGAVRRVDNQVVCPVCGGVEMVEI